jgi:hypothetical protein
MNKKVVRSIGYLILLLISFGHERSQAMNTDKSGEMVPELPIGKFFYDKPSLKFLTEIHLVKKMLNDPQFISDFQKSNIPDELKNISSVAKLLICMKELSTKTNHLDLLDMNYDYTKELPQIKKQVLNNLKNCIIYQANIVFNNVHLTNLWLLLLNDVTVQSQFKYGKAQVMTLLEATYNSLLVRGKYTVLYNWVIRNPSLKQQILLKIVRLFTRPLNDLIALFSKYHYSSLNLNQQSLLASNFYKEMIKFFEAIPANQLTDDEVLAQKLIALLYSSELLGHHIDLIKSIIKKGVDPNVNLAGYVASEYFFSERALELFNTDEVHEEKLELNKKFILFLVAHGLNITHLMAPNVAIEDEEKHFSDIARENFQLIIQENPEFKNELFKAYNKYKLNCSI